MNNVDYCDTTSCKSFYDGCVDKSKKDDKLTCDLLCSPTLVEGKSYRAKKLRTLCENRCNYGGIEKSYLCYQYCSFYPTNPVCGHDVEKRCGTTPVHRHIGLQPFIHRCLVFVAGSTQFEQD